MTVRDVIINVCEDEKMKLQDIAVEIGMNRANLSHLISHSRNDGQDMKISTLLRLLEPLGAELFVKDPNGYEYLIEMQEM